MKDALLCYIMPTLTIIAYKSGNEKYFHKFIQDYFGKLN